MTSAVLLCLPAECIYSYISETMFSVITCGGQSADHSSLAKLMSHFVRLVVFLKLSSTEQFSILHHVVALCVLLPCFACMGSLPQATSRDGILTFSIHRFASACCTLSQALYGTMQCLITATSAATLTAAGRAATPALAGMLPAIVTKPAKVSSAGWQCAHHSAIRGLRSEPSFGLR